MKVAKTTTKIYNKTVKGCLPDYISMEKSPTRKRYLLKLRETTYDYKQPYKQVVPSFDDLLKGNKQPFTLV
jgi:hypothetical protein